MLKRALLKCDCIIKLSALKTRSIGEEETETHKSTLVNNFEKSNQKNFNEYSLKIFFKTQKC